MWLEILRDQVAKRNPGGLGLVAAELGYSKSALSLVLNHKYDSSTARIEEAVLRTYGHIDCPFEARNLSAADCRFWREHDHPTSSSWAQAHWNACLECPHNPATQEPP
jgi:hypothetical protein